MASGGIGTLSHVEGELFKMMTGVSLVHVPYRGLGPAPTDLLGGQVQVMFASMSASIEYVRARRSPDSDFGIVVAPTGESMPIDSLSQTA
jgi:tripartite-type tricarboxylate transporter receptor subunit TctC